MTEMNSFALPTAPSEPLPRKRRFSAIDLIGISICLIAAIACMVAPIRNHFGKGTNKDYPLWFDTGKRMLRGDSAFYKDRSGEFPFMYPPAAAALLAPMTAYGKLTMVISMVVINSIAWIVCILAPVYLVSGTTRAHPPPMYWLPSLVCIFYIWSTYMLGGPAMVLGASILGMLVCLRHRIDWGAGLLVAFAAGFKAFPVLAVPYLLWRRRWKALGYTVGFLFILLLILPAYFRGWSGAVDDLKVWTRDTLSSYNGKTIGQRAARSYTWQNGSIIAQAHRLLRPVPADTDDNYPGEPQIIVNLASLSFRQINLVIVVASLVLCLSYIALMPRESVRTRWTDAIEGAMLMILIVTFTPLSFTYNNCWLMLPIVVVLYFIFRLARTRSQRTIAIIWLTVSLSLLIFTTGKPEAFRYPRALGNTFWCCMLLYGLLAWIMTRRIEDRSQPEPQTLPLPMTNGMPTT